MISCMPSTYRSARTGKITVAPERLAKRFPDLVEVGADAKPLAYTPIPAEKVAAVKAAKPAPPALKDGED